MYRAKHQADPLSWDADLAAGSQAWSDNCAFQHSNPNGAYGENLAMGHNSFVDAVDDWYNEVRAWARGRGRGASGRGGGWGGGEPGWHGLLSTFKMQVDTPTCRASWGLHKGCSHHPQVLLPVDVCLLARMLRLIW